MSRRPSRRARLVPLTPTPTLTLALALAAACDTRGAEVTPEARVRRFELGASCEP